MTEIKRLKRDFLGMSREETGAAIAEIEWPCWLTDVRERWWFTRFEEKIYVIDARWRDELRIWGYRDWESDDEPASMLSLRCSQEGSQELLARIHDQLPEILMEESL